MELDEVQVPQLSLKRGKILFDALSQIRDPVATGFRVLTSTWNDESAPGIEVCLKSTPRGIVCHNREELQFVLMAIGVTKQLRRGHTEIDEISSLTRIARELMLKLRAQYTPDEVAKGIGAVPGLKDVLLYLLIRERKPEIVIETGVAQGVSSSFILSALRKNGRGTLTSIDMPNYNPNGLDYPTGGERRDNVWVKPELGSGWIVPQDLRSVWNLIIGRSSKVLPGIEGQVDFFFHDSEHSYDNMTFELEWALSHLSDGGVICCDDISWNRAFHDFVARHRPSVFVISSHLKGICVKRILPIVAGNHL